MQKEPYQISNKKMGSAFKNLQVCRSWLGFLHSAGSRNSLRKSVLEKMEITSIQSDAETSFDFGKIKGIISKYAVLYEPEVC